MKRDEVYELDLPGKGDDDPAHSLHGRQFRLLRPVDHQPHPSVEPRKAWLTEDLDTGERHVWDAEHFGKALKKA